VAVRDLLRNAWAITAACCMDDAVALSTGRACDLRASIRGNSTLDIPRMRCFCSSFRARTPESSHRWDDGFRINLCCIGADLVQRGSSW